MKIYLFRHGETGWNKGHRLQGRSDIPLNEFGRELARITAKALEEVAFDRAFSSPLERALETAQIIIGTRDIPVQTDERLVEMNFGSYEGSSYDLPKKDLSHPLHDFFRKPESYVPPEGAESFQEVMERAASFLQEKILPLEGSCGNVLIAAHGAFNRCLLGTISQYPMDTFWEISLPNCAACILSLEKGKFRIEEVGKVYYGEPVNGRP
jgi:probable phosphoglycerate mutase